MKIQHLFATAEPSDPFTFVVSTEGMNRKGFRIRQDAWNLTHFLQNPIALWMHDNTAPIGTWENVKVQGGRLMATLKLAAPGTSAFIDGIRGLIEQGILKATSVGFRTLEVLEDKKTKELTVTKAELREISIVTVPADPGALRAMQTLSDDVRDRILNRKAPSGKTADPPSSKRNTTMSLAERIRALDAELNEKKTRLTALTEQEKLSDDESTELDTLAEQAEELGKRITSLRRAEAALAANAKSTKKDGTTYASPKRERQKAELLFRGAFVLAKSHVTNRPINDIILNDFGGDKELEVMTLAASNPAMTNVVGWAAELIDTQMGEFLDLLAPESVFARLAGLRVTFDRNGGVKLPGRSTRSLGGSFTGEGAPIPVRQAQLTSVLLSPFKATVITTMTRELAQRSAPAAEPLFRQMMIEDTAITIDGAFLDSGAASAVRPAGLQTLGTGTASAGATVANIMADLRGMAEGIISAQAGRRPVWVMNDIRRLGLMTALSTTEDTRPFADEIRAGSLLGYGIVTSINVPSGVVFLVDQAELAQGYGDSPAIDMSNQATLHMEDTNPLALATGTQGSGVVATPMRSMFQTDSLALRLVWDVSWVMRRAGACQFRTGVAW
jgi:HK97 family phage major capsid protein/HK97 family phage prohead protease